MDRINQDAHSLHAQAEIWKLLFGFADSMALKCAVELRIADIIHSHGRPLTLFEIASNISSPLQPDIACLARIMRLLVRMKIFASELQPDGGETVYGLTELSKWILHDYELRLAPMVFMQNHPWLLAPWHQLTNCVKEGGTAFQKAHGREIWDFASANPEFNGIFNDSMECFAKITMKAIVSSHKDRWAQLNSLVDVGGGTGAAIAEIVKAYPHIKGINFDLPHVIATAPNYDGVYHVGGDMFKAIPNAEGIMMKSIMHDWGDEDCVKILKNCRKAIPGKTGKLFIFDVVLKPDADELFDKTRMIFDLVMIAHSSGGKERTEHEWKKILEEGGFLRYKVIEILGVLSMIEASPE